MPGSHLNLTLADSQSWIAGLLMAAGVGIVTFILLARMRRRAGRAKQAHDPRQRMKHVVDRAAAREGLERLMVDVQELTRVCAAQIDTKAARLERLITDCDERIERLERLLEQHAEDPPRRAPARRPTDAAPPPPRAHRPDDAPRLDPLAGRVYELADSGLDTVEIARQLDEHVGKVDLILALRSHA